MSSAMAATTTMTTAASGLQAQAALSSARRPAPQLVARPRLPSVVRSHRRFAVVAAAETEKQQEEDDNFIQKRSDFANTGFVSTDTGGKSNVFAVEPTVVVEGSSDDRTQSSGSAALVAGSLAIAGVAAGLWLLKSQGSVTQTTASLPADILADAGDVPSKPLSRYLKLWKDVDAPAVSNAQ
eukprot:jgi/Chlat1/1753/Chrsp134S02082